MIDAKELIALGVPQDLAREWEGPLISVMAPSSINTTRRIAAFVAQLVHESNGFRTLEENLNYSASALVRLWPKRFPKILADQFGRVDGQHPANKEMIAAIAYGDRMGNGGVDTLDGWRFRGRGPIQLTGRNNYLACGDAIGVDLVHNPDRLLEPVIGALAAGWFWTVGNSTGKSLNAFADIGEIDRISKAINGGVNGLEHRRSLYEQALRVLA
jgi:putative chitinase